MMVLVERIAALCCIAVLALAGAASARAQEPPTTYVPPLLTLFPATGGYRLTWTAVSDAMRYAIRLGLIADDGTFVADGELANIEGSARTFDIDSIVPHTEPGRCYTVRWRVYALIGASAPEPPGELSVRMCADADNKSYYANVPSTALASNALPHAGAGPPKPDRRAHAIALALTSLGAIALIAVVRLRAPG
jgi:hypothetical protein